MAIGARVAAIYPTNPLRQNNVALYAMYAGEFDEALAKGRARRAKSEQSIRAGVGLAGTLRGGPRPL